MKSSPFPIFNHSLFGGSVFSLTAHGPNCFGKREPAEHLKGIRPRDGGVRRQLMKLFTNVQPFLETHTDISPATRGKLHSMRQGKEIPNGGVSCYY